MISITHVIFNFEGSGGSAEEFTGYINHLRAQPGLGHVKWLLPQAYVSLLD
jgi:hypothetical protein